MQKRLGEILVDLGVLTRAEAECIAKAQGRRDDAIKFGQLAKDLGLVTPEQILGALAVQMDIVPFALQKNIRKVLGDLKGPGPKSPMPIKLDRVQSRLGRR